MMAKRIRHLPKRLHVFSLVASRCYAPFSNNNSSNHGHLHSKASRTFSSSNSSSSSSVSSNNNLTQTTNNKLQVIQFRAARKGYYEEQVQKHQLPADATVYTATLPNHDDDDTTTTMRRRKCPKTNYWQTQSSDLVAFDQGIQDLEDPSPKTSSPLSTTKNSSTQHYSFQTLWFDNFLHHFLPAQYPSSVARGYAHFAGAAFVASVAGSASMVLSTQTLLLAVGVVGNSSAATAATSASASTAAEASVLAGALNWVAKDFIGQLGGVLFASRMGESKQYDGNPKKWRMVAALALDAACLLEILSPTVVGIVGLSNDTNNNSSSSSSSNNHYVLAVACTANVLKNIGFLTAGASRAALHQSLAVTGNLADVTAKSAAQSMAAGLLGTGLGIALSSSSLLATTTTTASTTATAISPIAPFAVAFCVLALIHQGCNYISLSSIHLTHLDKHRLYILLQEFVGTQQVLSPQQVSEREVWFWPPPRRQDDTQDWLTIGSDLVTLCPGGGAELELLLSEVGTAHYIMNVLDGRRIHLTFLQDADSPCLIQGMLAAVTLHRSLQAASSSGHDVDMLRQLAHKYASKHRPILLEAMKEQGWKMGPGETNIEPKNAVRFDIRRKS